MTPEQAKFLTQVLVAQLRHECTTTARVLGAVPDDQHDWKPDPHARSAWDLATHIASVDVGFLQGIAAGHFDGPSPDPQATTGAELAAWYSVEFPKALEVVAAMDGDDLVKPVTFYAMRLPNVTYLTFCNNHMIHHRGQLATYLRPMGAKVPAIYGGSYDETPQG